MSNGGVAGVNGCRFAAAATFRLAELALDDVPALPAVQPKVELPLGRILKAFQITKFLVQLISRSNGASRSVKLRINARITSHLPVVECGVRHGLRCEVFLRWR